MRKWTNYRNSFSRNHIRPSEEAHSSILENGFLENYGIHIPFWSPHWSKHENGTEREFHIPFLESKHAIKFSFQTIKQSIPFILIWIIIYIYIYILCPDKCIYFKLFPTKGATCPNVWLNLNLTQCLDRFWQIFSLLRLSLSQVFLT